MKRFSAPSLVVLLSCFLGVLLSGCTTSQMKKASESESTGDPCSIAFAAHRGESKIDQEIVRLQRAARDSSHPVASLEALAWAFISKARQSYDPGYYKLAQACADCLDSRRPDSPEALLIRGHAFASLHHFKAAEALARRLVAIRDHHADWGLLGDTLMEQGRLTDAIEAYQHMLDLKPGPQSYTRAAHMRWLKGDLEGAIEMMRRAARAGSGRENESSAWNYSRLALYELQAGSKEAALTALDTALALVPDYAPALLIRGRFLLAEGKNGEAVEFLRRAAAQNPLPEYQWALAEALRTSGRSEEAAAVDAELKRTGATADSRTFAVYLATRGEDTELASTLARDEMRNRSDVFTLDALAWALASSGNATEAAVLIKRATAEGTKDARLFFHAGSIAAMSDDRDEARRWLGRAYQIRHMLLPSERERLASLVSKL